MQDLIISTLINLLSRYLNNSKKLWFSQIVE